MNNMDAIVSDSLDKLGIPSKGDDLKSVVVDGGGVVLWTDDEASAPFEVSLITTPSLEKVKEWMGSPDVVLRESNLTSTPPLSTVSADNASVDELALAARHFVYNDSATVAAFTPRIEEAFGPFKVQAASADVITIKAGQTLRITGTTPKTIVANELIFEGAGANIESFVHLSMKVGKVVVR